MPLEMNIRNGKSIARYAHFRMADVYPDRHKRCFSPYPELVRLIEINESAIARRNLKSVGVDFYFLRYSPKRFNPIGARFLCT